MKKKAQFASVKNRLIFWFFVVSLLPLITVSGVVYRQRAKSIKEEAFRKLTAIRSLKVAQVNGWLDRKAREIKAISLDTHLRSLENILGKDTDSLYQSQAIRNAREHLDNHLRNSRDYHEIFIINSISGVINISTDMSQEGKDKSKNLYFTRPLETRNGFIRDIYFSKTVEKPSMAFSIPINCFSHKGKHIVGILVARVDLEHSLYALLLNRIGMGKTGETLIVNEDVVALNELRWYENAPFKLKISAKPETIASQGGIGITEATDYRGEAVLAAYAYLPRIKWGFVAKQDLKEVYAPIRSLLWNISILLVLSILVVYGVAIFLGKNIARPILKMAEVSKKIQKGDLSVRNQIQSIDELGFLAMTFNKMADSISTQIDIIKQGETLLRKERDSLEVTVEKRTAALRQELSDRKKADSALKESEEKYRSVLESMEEGYYEVDLAGNFTFFNEAMCKIRGQSRDELMEVNNRAYMSEATAKKAYKAYTEIYTTGIPAKNLEWETIRPDGLKTHLEVSASLMRDSKGQPIGFRGVVRDVTEKKRFEEEKAKLEAQLQQAHKMEVIGTLAGGVAHDLNNILSGIVSYPELILLDLPEDSPLKKPILTIQKSGQKATVIVQDLLTLARRGVTITEVVNLNHIISEQLKSPEFEKLLSFNPDVKVETDLENDLLTIKGSTAHLSKSVMNLVSNAAEAMIDGGTIFISTENRYIDRPVKGYDHVEEGDYVMVTVSDTGVGISSEDMERIFEPFYTKKVMGRSGTGLGMAVVWGTVKDHHGYIDFQSTEGKGTTFTIYFPATREEAVTDKSLLSIEDYMGKGETILVIDDVEEQREIASGMLRKLGYSVTSVSSGEEAVEYLKNNTVDLLVLDMIMDPGIDGLETYKRILKVRPGQKAIIASGFSESARVKEAKKLGAGAYVKKPYLIEKIGVIVRSELEK